MEAAAHGAAGAQPAQGASAPSEQPRSGESSADAHGAASSDDFAQRPELYLGAAFVGGIVAARVLRLLRR